jgi:adenylylsulfate kinase
MTKRILVMGLPGSGKTTFTQDLVKSLMINHTVKWFNADAVRKQFNDWDFSAEGRLRQVNRMRELADNSGADFAICDFVCPTEEYRTVFEADTTVWLDTIEAGRFEDTNKVFERPTKYTYRIWDWEQNDEIIHRVIADLISKKGDSHLRSVVKAISWRAWGTLDTIVLSWIVTGHVGAALTIGALEVTTKVFWFWLHERMWTKVKWGTK